MMDPARLTAFSGLRTLPGGAPGPAPAMVGVPDFAFDFLSASDGADITVAGTPGAGAFAATATAAGIAVKQAGGVTTTGMLAQSIARYGAEKSPPALSAPTEAAASEVESETEVEASLLGPGGVWAVKDELEPVAIAVVAVPPQETLSRPVVIAAPLQVAPSISALGPVTLGGGEDDIATASDGGISHVGSAASLPRTPIVEVTSQDASVAEVLPPAVDFMVEFLDDKAPTATMSDQSPLPSTGTALGAAGRGLEEPATGTGTTALEQRDVVVTGMLPTGEPPVAAGRGADETDLPAERMAPNHRDAGAPASLTLLEIPDAVSPVVAPGKQAPAVPAPPAISSRAAGTDPGATMPPYASLESEGYRLSSAPAAEVSAEAVESVVGVTPIGVAGQSLRKGSREQRSSLSAGTGVTPAAAVAEISEGASLPASVAQRTTPTGEAVAASATSQQAQLLPAEAERTEGKAGAEAVGEGVPAPAEGSWGEAAAVASARGETVTRIATTPPPAPLVESAVPVVEPPQPIQPSAQAEATRPDGAAADAATALDAAWRQMVLDVQKQGWTQALVRRVAGLASTGGTLAVQVYPPALGRMLIRVAETPRGLDLRVSSELAATAAMMGEAEQRISHLLESAGLRLADYSSQTGGTGADGRGDGGNGSQRSSDDAIPVAGTGPRIQGEDPTGVAGATARADGHVDLIA